MGFKQPPKFDAYPDNIPMPMEGVEKESGKILFYYQHITKFGLYEFWYEEDGSLYHYRTSYEKDENEIKRTVGRAKI